LFYFGCIIYFYMFLCVGNLVCHSEGMTCIRRERSGENI
jgi:hypothetical protein